MMDYETFKKTVEDRFMGYMPEDMQGMKLDIRQVDKVNVTMEALSLIQKEGTVSISPTVYINEMYAEYVRYGDVDRAIRAAASRMQQAMRAGHTVLDLMDKGAARDNIVFQLINTGQNRRLLTDIPSRPFLDLSVIYRWVVHIDGDDIQSTIVTDKLAEQLGFTEGQLYEAAMLNTRRLFPPDSVRLDDAILKVSSHLPAEQADVSVLDIPKKIDMWLLTNTRMMYGAVSMMYEDQLQTVADNLGDDLYVLPSSIHEVIAIPARPVQPDEMAGIVHTINMEGLLPEERLSNQVYHYDRVLHKLTLATDTPDKRLLG